jgi:3-isopropylmalate dehydrogenase
VSRTLRIATIPGDGIGPEVTRVAVAVAEAALAGGDTRLEITEFNLGAHRWLETGESLTDVELDDLRSHDAILLGAVGDPAVPSGILERELLLRLRFSLDQAVNLRPARTLPGVASPLAANPDIDLVVVREGTEGPYAGNGGSFRHGTEHEIATEESINTRFGIERVVRFAFDQAAGRRGHLTLVHKTNVLTHAGGLWARTVAAVAEDYPQVTTAYCHADAAAMFLVSDPGRFDVIVTDNLFGDLISDVAAIVTGGIGLAASGNINVSGAAPSMFEPVHGSAPDIAGQDKADPTAAVLSAAMMLRHLGEGGAADRVETAVLAARPSLTGLGTVAAGQAIAAQL